MLSQRESYTPTRWHRFLWWLSTAEKEFLTDSITDRNRYAIIGMTVLCTWVFATLSWSYFFSTTVNSIPAAIALGLLMGGIILSIDRALIKGINQFNRNRLLPFLLRGILALTIGLFMAQPALLYLFSKEVHLQISLDNEQKKKLKMQQEDSLFLRSKNELITTRGTLQAQLNNKYAEVAAARNAFIAETDGTGGSGKVGLKDIAKAKQAEYLKSDREYAELQSRLLPSIASADSSLRTIDVAQAQERAAFNGLLNDGFLTRIEALDHLVTENGALRFRYYLLITLLMLIELMPILAKSLLPPGAYDEKVRLRETMEKEMAKSNTEKEHQLKELYNRLAFEQDSQFIAEFFEDAAKERKEKLKTQWENWRQDEKKSMDNVWDDTKRFLLTRQEN